MRDPERRSRRGERGRDGTSPVGSSSSGYSDTRRSSRRSPPAKRKKLRPKAIRHLRNALLESHFGYSNQNNPFGDSTLAEPFVWEKKNAYLKAAGKEIPNTEKDFFNATQQKISEIESVRKRRELRELEEKLLEEQRALLSREKEQENYDEWLRKEDDFHRAQALKRTDIRLEEGREKPIDIVVKLVRLVEGRQYEDPTVKEAPPDEMLRGMSVKEITEFIEDVNVYIGPDVSPEDRQHQKFWKAILLVAQTALDNAKRSLEPRPSSDSLQRDLDSGIPLSVMSCVESLLSAKSPAELELLEKKVGQKLDSGLEEVDPAYWEAVRAKLPLYRSIAEVHRVHALARSKARTPLYPPAKESGKEHIDTSGLLPSNQPSAPVVVMDTNAPAEPVATDTAGVSGDGCLSPELQPYDEDDIPPPLPRSVSPSLIPFSECREGSWTDPVEDRRNRLYAREEAVARLRLQRATRLQAAESTSGVTTAEDSSLNSRTFASFVRKETQLMEKDEHLMEATQEASLHTQYDWEDKYRPRKPRYFNRVKTGYEWNKYNQTHYDHDNPPPKSVQGYKFNIFYPDLIDKTQTPSWTLEPSDTPETVILRFHAGPPYEDIAFKVINRQWEMTSFRGFRNVFDRGILQLYFNFTRYRYRR